MCEIVLMAKYTPKECAKNAILEHLLSMLLRESAIKHVLIFLFAKAQTK